MIVVSSSIAPETLAKAIAVAATFSGVPSTAVALKRREDPLAAAKSAATIVGVAPSPAGRALAVGWAVHVAISTFWGAVLARVLPTRRRVAAGALAGAAIYVLDMEIVARAMNLRAIRALPRGGQLADHIAFGALLGWVLDRHEPPPPPTPNL